MLLLARKLGVEKIDEGEIPGDLAEHGETGAVVGEIGVVLWFRDIAAVGAAPAL
jgi:hypothetical protein